MTKLPKTQDLTEYRSRILRVIKRSGKLSQADLYGNIEAVISTVYLVGANHHLSFYGFQPVVHPTAGIGVIV